MFVAAFDVESPASYLITVPFPKAQTLIDLFGRNFDLMSDYLSFTRNKLAILNPVTINRSHHYLGKDKKDGGFEPSNTEHE